MRSLMENMPVHSFRQEFARHARWRREEDRHALNRNNEREEREKARERDRIEDQDAFMDFAFSFVIATDEQIAAFTVKLDTYDAATIEALMENEQALEQVREELRIMLDKAYVLPDGRRVFKTEEGTRVFDEYGEEITDFDPEQIEDWRPRWERFSDGLEKRDALEAERVEILDYQGELDEARERAAEDGLTEAELEDLELRIEQDMPDAVKRHLTGEHSPAPDDDKPEPPQQQATFQPAGKLDMPSL